MSQQTDIRAQEVLVEELVASHEIILFNDDVHTFDYVIDSLIEICDHDPIQAEQCTYIVHHNGKCSVKKGTYDELEPRCTALLDRGLTAEIA
ncbi:MAG: ATP-dependent Clp protease adaptor ClpS [Cryomorphaceae bacterium]|nr:MAG: ATP-dependent Clp protease adaptor ClpS [Cryomorphaceae bacterium]